jgi:nicotinate-nucleotide pyrophosphorylase
MTAPFLKNYYTFVDTTLINALVEDIGSGDITSLSLIPQNHVQRRILSLQGCPLLRGLLGW